MWTMSGWINDFSWIFTKMGGCLRPLAIVRGFWPFFEICKDYSQFNCILSDAECDTWSLQRDSHTHTYEQSNNNLFLEGLVTSVKNTI